MSTPNFPRSLLRPPVLHILRAAGYHSTRSSVVDSLSDLAARYMMVLAEVAATHFTSHDHLTGPEVEDFRRAMEDCGVFRPQRHATDEDWLGEEDLRGVQAFMEWFTGDVNREIMRIAGTTTSKDGAALNTVKLEVTGNGDDFLAVLMKKHNKSGNERRYQGTALGRPSEDRPIRIEGGPVSSLHDWTKSTVEKGLGTSRLAPDQDVGGIES
ncbi:MAG: hypothetical protein M1816_001138 [Peltula sp. TS41687]|nr:MAG: hypothetical protein M1816_001138 [Peltula sp. TS41687]